MVTIMSQQVSITKIGGFKKVLPAANLTFVSNLTRFRLYFSLRPVNKNFVNRTETNQVLFIDMNFASSAAYFITSVRKTCT